MSILSKEKNQKILIPFYIILLLILSLQQSCKKEEECIPPELDSITFQNDSLKIDYLIPTRYITMYGKHFTDAVYIYINRLKYDATYIYHTDSTLTFSVPYVVSNGLATDNQELTDSLMITKGCGKSVLLVRILTAPPYISKISNENAIAGDIITLQGKFFDILDTIKFPSNKIGEVVEIVNDSICKVRVPDGVINEGELVLVSPSGSSTSAYALDFRDRTGLLCNFDDVDTWQGWGGEVIHGTEDQDIPPALGYFFKSELFNIAPGSGEIENSVLPITIEVMPEYSGNLSPAYFAIQAELYFKYPWKCGQYKILFGKVNDDEQIEYSYEFNYKPWLDSLNGGELTTDGWRTLNIPLTRFMLSGSTTVALQSYSQLRLMNYMQWSFINPGEEEGGKPVTHFKMALDNIRLIQIAPDPD